MTGSARARHERRVHAVVTLLGLATALALLHEAWAQDARPDALTRIRKRGQLVWGADSQGGAPYVFQDPRDPGRLIGFEVDLAEALAAKLGVKARFQQCQYDKLLDLLNRGDDIDVAINGMEADEEKKRVCGLSRPYYVAAERLAVRAKDALSPRSLEELRGRPVGTLPTTLAERLLKDAGVDVRAYDSGLETVYHDLSIGRLDAVLIDEPTATYYAVLEPGVAVLERSFGEVRYAVATPKGEQPLVDALDGALEELRSSGKLREIYERWGIWNAETAVLFHDPRLRAEGKATAHAEWLAAVPARTFLERVREYPRYLPLLLEGAAWTLGISLAAFVLAAALGMALAISRRYGALPLRLAAACYIEVFRGTPLLVQLYFIYFGLPEVGVTLAPLTAGILGLALNYAAAEAENYRAGIESVPAGQLEACWSLGLTTWQAVRHVVLPQAVRVAIPPATNDFIALLKDSSLVSAITMTELLRVTSNLASATRDNRGMYALCALIYLLLGLPFARLARYAETRLGAHLRRAAP